MRFFLQSRHLLACLLTALGVYLSAVTGWSRETGDPSTLIEAQAYAHAGKHRDAIRAADRILRDRELSHLWDEALMDKIRWLADSGRASAAISEAMRGMRASEFSHMSTQLHWWTVVLHAGPGNNLRRAIVRAEELATGPKEDPFVERAAYALGIMLMWDNKRFRAREALEAYIWRFGDEGRYTKAARNYLNEV